MKSLLTEAAAEIRKTAEELRASSTVHGEWDGSEPDAQAEYERQMALVARLESAANDRVEGRDAASSRRVPSHDGLCGNGTEVGAGDTAMKGKR